MKRLLRPFKRNKIETYELEKNEENRVNKYSTEGYIPGILAIMQVINICLLFSDIKYKLEMHKTTILHACFCADVKLGPLH